MYSRLRTLMYSIVQIRHRTGNKLRAWKILSETIKVGPWIKVGPRKIGKKNIHRTWKKFQKIPKNKRNTFNKAGSPRKNSKITKVRG